MADVVTEVVSLRECARRLGVSLAALQKAIASTRVTCVRWEGERRVGVEWPTAREQYAQNTDPGEAAKNGKVWAPSVTPETEHSAGRASTVSPGAGAAVDARRSMAEGAGDSALGDLVDAAAEKPAPVGEPAQPRADGSAYHEHRARREEYDAELRRIELLKQLALLVPVADVAKSAASTARIVRDAMLVMPDRLAAQLAAETDPARVHSILSGEIRTALYGLSQQLAGAGAGSAAGPG